MGDANTVILPLKIGFIFIQIVLTILIAYTSVSKYMLTLLLLARIHNCYYW